MNRKKLNQELRSIIDKIKQVQDKNDARKFVEKYCKFINNLVSEKDYHIELNGTSPYFIITNSDHTHSILVDLKKFIHVTRCNDIEPVMELFVLKGTYTDERYINVRVDTIEGLSKIISKTVTWLGDKVDSRKITKAYDIVLSDERISKVFGKSTLEAIHLRSSMNSLIDKIEIFLEFEKIDMISL